jgi:1-acyl-sn-glycerol-3-phosphate acyltransferase
MAFLWSLVVIDPLIILSTILCGCISIVVSLFDTGGNAAIRVARMWARSLLAFAGVRVTVEGLDKIDPAARHVFCSNHLSYMDTPVVLGHIPSQFRFLAKAGLFEIPFLGTHLKQAGHIPVPRKDPRAAVKTLTRAADGIREHAVSMLIFPEGGRSTDGQLHDFKEGAAYIAIKAQVPLVPIALVGTRDVLAMHSAVFHPFRRVRLCIGDPIPTAGLTLRDRQELTEVARAQVAAMLEPSASEARAMQ